MIQLRPFQLEAKNAVLDQWCAGIDKTILILPTGTGKTIVFSSIIEELVRKGGRVLILAHREELLDQAADKLHRTCGLGAALEKAQSRAHDCWENVVVGSIQTLQREDRRKNYPRDFFSAIIVDEAHHVLAKSYLNTLAHFDAKVLGVTATADRGDKRNLGEYFETVAYEYTLPRAVRDGWLTRPKAMTLPVKIDISGVKITSGDFNAAQIGHALDPYLSDIADQMKEHCKTRKTVCFLPLISTGQKFAAMLKERGMNVREVNYTSEDRKEIVKWFDTAPPGSIICNAMLLTEGWDCESADCIAFLRPTKIRSLYAQAVGRILRLYPGKTDALILDFLWHTERLDLCRPASLICQNPDIAARVSEILAESTSDGEGKDLLDEEEAAENSAMHEREESLRKLLEEQRAKRAKLVDPLQYEASISGSRIDEYTPDMHDLRAMAPPTQKQLDALEKAGISGIGITCQGHANRILDALSIRRSSNLGTPRQIRCLERFGFKDVGTWDFDSAKSMIDQIAGNMWRVPRHIIPETYQPKNLKFT